MTIGDNNTVSVHSASENIQWKEIKDECLKTITRLPDDSAEKEAAEELYTGAVQKDGNKLKQVIKKYSKQFLSDIFIKSSSALLVEFIKGMLL